jgi:hypothetical protein
MSSTDQMTPTKIVRRFTEELEPASDLAIQTKEFQKRLDDEVESRDRLRMDRIYNGQNGQQKCVTIFFETRIWHVPND